MVGKSTGRRLGSKKGGRAARGMAPCSDFSSPTLHTFSTQLICILSISALQATCDGLSHSIYLLGFLSFAVSRSIPPLSYQDLYRAIRRNPPNSSPGSDRNPKLLLVASWAGLVVVEISTFSPRHACVSHNPVDLIYTGLTKSVSTLDSFPIGTRGESRGGHLGEALFESLRLL